MALVAQKSKDIAIVKSSSLAPAPDKAPPSGLVAPLPNQALLAALRHFSIASMTPPPLHPSFNAPSLSISPSPQWPVDNATLARKRPKNHSPAQRYDRDFTPEQEHDIPPLLTNHTIPEDLDINLVIDDQGYTAFHWAAALARIQVLELLVQKHADVDRINNNGESALIRAVLVTNNYDKQSFQHLLSILHRVITTVDRKNRTMLHHITMMTGVRGRGAASRHYMECLLEWIARNEGDFSSLVDTQDKNGYTALTIAARVGDRYLARFLINVGANREIENKVGLRAADFGVDDLEGHLKDTQSLLRNATQELTGTRGSIINYTSQVQQVSETQQKIKNLSLSLEEEYQRIRSHKEYNSKLRPPSGEDIDLLFNVRKRTSSDGMTTTGAVEVGVGGEDLKTREDG
ncbi:transcriptional regulator swi6 [Mortierella hygrophila]|uniref:Transcriptional regulator swi6 n=1 Tax=Mortierella hygrophila TaxID=979708 RepID=A0A9P6F0Y2_9FUNG|nr:transcriptional regulator swi6 [Mortierella hygrophila]